MLHKSWNWTSFRIFLPSSGFLTCSLIYRFVFCNRNLDRAFFPHFFTRWPHNYLPVWLNSWIWDQINSLHINEHIKYKEHINSKSVICLLALQAAFSKGITFRFALHQVQDWACSSGHFWSLLLSLKSCRICWNNPCGGQLWLPKEMQNTEVYSLSASPDYGLFFIVKKGWEISLSLSASVFFFNFPIFSFFSIFLHFLCHLSFL